MACKYYCDGCGKLLDLKDLTDSLQAAQQAAPSLGNLLPREVFCPRCLARAPEYWQELLALEKTIAEEREQRLGNHRKQFFRPQIGKPMHVVAVTP